MEKRHLRAFHVVRLFISKGARTGPSLSEKPGKDFREQQHRRGSVSAARIHTDPSNEGGRQRGDRSRLVRRERENVITEHSGNFQRFASRQVQI